MFCNRCGFSNAPAALFCENCGAILSQDIQSAGKSILLIYPIFVNAFTAVLFALSAFGLIIFSGAAIKMIISYAQCLPIKLYSMDGTFFILYIVAMVLAVLLLPIILNFLAFKGLWNSDASGYKWGLGDWSALFIPSMAPKVYPSHKPGFRLKQVNQGKYRLAIWVDFNQIS